MLQSYVPSCLSLELSSPIVSVAFLQYPLACQTQLPEPWSAAAPPLTVRAT